MAFKIPLVQTKSLSKGYFEGLLNFVWSDVKDKDEIGKGSFGSVMKGNYIPNGKVVVVKRFFGEGDSHLRNVAKEAKMLKSLCHPNITQFMGVCSKPLALMMEYEYFDFTLFVFLIHTRHHFKFTRKAFLPNLHPVIGHFRHSNHRQQQEHGTQVCRRIRITSWHCQQMLKSVTDAVTCSQKNFVRHHTTSWSSMWIGVWYAGTTTQGR